MSDVCTTSYIIHTTQCPKLKGDKTHLATGVLQTYSFKQILNMRFSTHFAFYIDMSTSKKNQYNRGTGVLQGDFFDFDFNLHKMQNALKNCIFRIFLKVYG